jgi:hypothetical protein
MFAFTLKSLMLRGLVRKVGLCVLGFGLKADSTPGNPNSMRQPTPAFRRPEPTPTDVVGYPTKSIRSGAGRSRRHAGSSLAEMIASSTRLWWKQIGGLATAAAANARALSASVAATVNEATESLAIFPITEVGMQDRSA